jgi:hypothetical protein
LSETRGQLTLNTTDNHVGSDYKAELCTYIMNYFENTLQVGEYTGNRCE